MLMDMCWPKFYIYQGTLAPNCIKSHANSYVLILKSFVLCLVWNFLCLSFLPDSLSGLKENYIQAYGFGNFMEKYNHT